MSRPAQPARCSSLSLRMRFACRRSSATAIALLGPLLLAAAAPAMRAQAPAATASPQQLAIADALNATQPLLGQISSATSSLDLRRWKVPGDVRDTTASDIQSIQKDLNQTLPGLIDQARNAPNAIAPSFAVFRNMDALYDVLLRVTETATLAGTQNEAATLEQVRAQLQARRGQLGNALLASATAQDSSIVQLQAAQRAAAASAAQAAATPKKIVINDGPPDAPAKPARKKKPATAAPPPPAQ